MDPWLIDTMHALDHNLGRDLGHDMDISEYKDPCFIDVIQGLDRDLDMSE